MAAGGRFLSCMLAVLSALLTPGHGGYQQIVLTRASGVSCNMSSRYFSGIGRSSDCWGALNGNTSTTYAPGVNCMYTNNRQDEYWLVNLGQLHNIHRIIIYPEVGFVEMKGTRVLVDDIQIAQLPSNRQITTTQFITNNLPVRGQIIKLTRSSGYFTLCELQVEECTTDTYGAGCTNPCSHGCLQNGGGRTCDALSGICSHGCQPDSLGPQCDKQCPQECKVPCDTNTGNCPECNSNFALPNCTQCKPGWYGVRCDAPCSAHCKPEVDGDIRCQQNDGVCNSGCVSGWYRPNCTVPCPANCDGGCQEDDGVCNGCKTGFFGPRCELSCGKGCVDNVCNRQDGICNCTAMWSSPSCTECVSGYYREGSCIECSSRCLGDDVCNNDNGHCPRGCDSGFDGDRCDRCIGTRWGSDCSLPCGQCAGDGSCYALTGHCVSGCVEGFCGDNCTLKLASDETQDGGNLAGPLVGGLLGAGALIGIAILLAAFIIRRRRSRDTSNSADTDGVQFSSGNAPIEDVTEGDKPETGTSGNESNYAQLEKNENPDDIRPYSVLEDGDKLPIYLNIQSDQETAVYQNTTVSKN